MARYEKEIYAVEILRDTQTGVAVTESWKLNGEHHRVDGPASISRDPETGNLRGESWFKTGKLHREGGPANIEYNAKNGRITYSTWLLNGEKIPRPTKPRRASKSTPNAGIKTPST
jgi:hypothetical protein